MVSINEISTAWENIVIRLHAVVLHISSGSPTTPWTTAGSSNYPWILSRSRIHLIGSCTDQLVNPNFDVVAVWLRSHLFFHVLTKTLYQPYSDLLQNWNYIKYTMGNTTSANLSIIRRQVRKRVEINSSEPWPTSFLPYKNDKPWCESGSLPPPPWDIMKESSRDWRPLSSPRSDRSENSIFVLPDCVFHDAAKCFQKRCGMFDTRGAAVQVRKRTPDALKK